jgi:hypothetical protein
MAVAPDSPRRPGRAAWWTFQRLVYAAVLIAWAGGSGSLVERFEDARDCWTQDEGGRTYQGFAKAWLRVGLRPLREAAATLRASIADAVGVRRRVGRHVAIAADGSRFELPRTAEHLRVFGTGSKKSGGPQLWITTLWDIGLGLPWAWKIGRANASERSHLTSMLALTPAGCVLVLDAGFVGYGLLSRIVGSGRHFLVRAGRRAELITRLGYARHEGRGVVSLWPAYAQRRGQPPLTLRLIRLRLAGDRRKKMYLLTDLTDVSELGEAEAGELYARRWGVEVCYRTLKVTLEAAKLRAGSPAMALVEIEALLLGLTLLAWRGGLAIPRGGARPLRFSPATGLKVVRRAMKRPQRHVAWEDLLAEATIDLYPRRCRKRVPWPRKKAADPPPGRPRLRQARAEERRLAAQLAVN